METTPSARTVNLSGDIAVTYWMRPANGRHTIVFIHGFGSAKEHFRHAFGAPELEGSTLVAADLVGFGGSRGPEEFGYAMRDQAVVLIELLDSLEIGAFHLCGHSMGGLVAMEVAELKPQRVVSLIDVEGNLTPEDCFISGMIVGDTYEEFAEKGRRNFEKELADAGIADPAMREYAETFAQASTAALYRSARHTVDDSSTPLVERLARIGNACYIYGEKNRGVYPGEALLRAAGVPIFYVERAGHSMATENPRGLYGVIRSFID